ARRQRRGCAPCGSVVPPEEKLTPKQAHSPVSFLDRSDLACSMALRPQYVERAMHLVRREYHDHADAEIEDVRHLGTVDVTESLDLVEDPRRLPRAALDDRVAALGQHPG